MAERDLEDFAQFGLRWSPEIDAQATAFRLRLESDDEMALRVFISSRGEAAVNGTLPATAAVADPAAIDRILALKDAPANGEEVFAGVPISWTDSGDTNLGVDAFAGPGGDQFLQLMFEGMKAGSGQLHFEVMRHGTVLASSSMDLRLRPTEEMYDRHSVAYGPYVEADGTFKDELSFDPLDVTAPVPTVSSLESDNKERDRVKAESDDYFMFVHGWRMKRDERIAFAESTFKRMYWSGFKGQFGMFDWPTLNVDDPVKDAGNFNRSEFIAWHSAAGLSDALHSIRANHIPSNGKLSAMGHSMGNVVLGEALHLNEAAGGSGNKLVNTAVMSQAAVSGSYFNSRADAVSSIYFDPAGNETMQEALDDHLDDVITRHSNPDWVEYNAFYPDGQSIDGIGGLTPRFRAIRESTDKLLNYYNPDDYALAGWKVVQLAKPTSAKWSTGGDLLLKEPLLEYGNVVLPGFSAETIATWLGSRTYPGFAETSYEIDVPFIGSNYQIVREYSGQTAHPDVTLNFAQDAYEMLAFGASSIVAAVGGVNNMNGLTGVFDDGIDLSTLAGTTKFSAFKPGHSAQFIHSYSGVKAYWDRLNQDIQ